MFIINKPKKLRKNIRTNIKKTNTKKLKVSQLELKEFKKELSLC